jgi:hypothetical protein
MEPYCSWPLSVRAEALARGYLPPLEPEQEF